MKNIFKYISAFVLAVLAVASCEKFLDTVSYTESNTSNYPASAQDAMQLVTGIYAALNQASYEPSAHSFIANLTMSDECFGGGGQDHPGQYGHRQPGQGGGRRTPQPTSR